MPINTPITFYEGGFRRSSSRRSCFHLAVALRSEASDGGRGTGFLVQGLVASPSYDLASRSQTETMLLYQSTSIALQGFRTALSIQGFSTDGPNSRSSLSAIASTRSVAYGITISQTSLGIVIAARSQNNEVLLVRTSVALVSGFQSQNAEIPHSESLLTANLSIQSLSTNPIPSASQVGLLASISSVSALNGSQSSLSLILSLNSPSEAAESLSTIAAGLGVNSLSFETGIASQVGLALAMQAGTGTSSQYSCIIAIQPLSLEIDTSESFVGINSAIDSVSSPATLGLSQVAIALSAESQPFEVTSSDSQVQAGLAITSDSYLIPFSESQVSVSTAISSVPVLTTTATSALGLALSFQSVSEESSQQDEYTFAVY